MCACVCACMCAYVCAYMRVIQHSLKQGQSYLTFQFFGFFLIRVNIDLTVVSNLYNGLYVIHAYIHAYLCMYICLLCMYVCMHIVYMYVYIYTYNIYTVQSIKYNLETSWTIRYSPVMISVNSCLQFRSIH